MLLSSNFRSSLLRSYNSLGVLRRGFRMISGTTPIYTAGMCATAKDIIGIYCSDMELCELLFRLQEKIAGSSLALPSNVIDDVNPFQFEPSNLPGGDIWYFVIGQLEGSKLTKAGVWKELGEPCLIYATKSLMGWRRTHEFQQGPSPPTAEGRKSRWMMQEYWVCSADSTDQKGSTSLCRVFLCDDGEVGNTGLPNKDATKATPDKDSKPGQAHISAVQVEMAREDECFSDSDKFFLEDLDKPLSPSSSSDNSSCFDADALLQEIDHGDEAYSQPRAVTHQLNVSRPSDAVVLSVGSADTFAASPEQERTVLSQPIMEEESVATSAPDRGLPDKDCNKRKAEVMTPSSSGDPGASSSRQRPPGNERGKKVHVGKLMKKFFCIMTF